MSLARKTLKITSEILPESKDAFRMSGVVLKEAGFQAFPLAKLVQSETQKEQHFD